MKAVQTLSRTEITWLSQAARRPTAAKAARNAEIPLPLLQKGLTV
jgi:hypothetical protein